MLDYGGQYSQLIARRVRECGVFSELLPHHVGAEEVARRRPKGLILSGGPASVYAPGAPEFDRCAARARHPRARHLLRHAAAGARARRRASRPPRSASTGGRELTIFEPGVLFAGHAERAAVLDVAPRHRLRGAARFRLRSRRRRSRRSPRSSRSSAAIYGIQFHPEVVHTPYGQEVLTHFLRDVCECEMTWSAASIVEEQIARVRGTGRRRKGHLRAVRRRRLVGRGAARPPGDRRPADVRLRRSRADAQERGRAGDRDLPRPVRGAARGRRRRGSLPRQARRCQRAGGEAQDHRRRVHPRVRGGGGPSSATRSSSSRARSTRT